MEEIESEVIRDPFCSGGWGAELGGEGLPSNTTFPTVSFYLWKKVSHLLKSEKM